MPAGEPSTLLVELPNPFEDEEGSVRVLEPADCDRAAIAERLRTGDYGRPFVVDDGESRTLYFARSYAQSAMRLSDPYALEFAYTRKMMGFLLLVPEPREVVVLGLGGGSLAKFCHRHLPRARIEVVEIDPDILALRGEFRVPPDDARLRVLQDDAARYVRERSDPADVVLMDAFDRGGYASSLSHGRFYADVRELLARDGLLVANLVGKRAERVGQLELMASAFDGNVLVVPVEEDGNHVAFAFRDPSFEPRWRWIARQAGAMGRRYGLDFARIAARLERSRKLGYLRRMLASEE